MTIAALETLGLCGLPCPSIGPATDRPYKHSEDRSRPDAGIYAFGLGAVRGGHNSEFRRNSHETATT